MRLLVLSWRLFFVLCFSVDGAPIDDREPTEVPGCGGPSTPPPENRFKVTMTMTYEYKDGVRIQTCTVKCEEWKDTKVCPQVTATPVP